MNSFPQVYFQLHALILVNLAIKLEISKIVPSLSLLHVNNNEDMMSKQDMHE